MDQNLLNDDYENYRINKEGYYIINQKKLENKAKYLNLPWIILDSSKWECY